MYLGNQDLLNILRLNKEFYWQLLPKLLKYQNEIFYFIHINDDGIKVTDDDEYMVLLSQTELQSHLFRYCNKIISFANITKLNSFMIDFINNQQCVQEFSANVKNHSFFQTIFNLILKQENQGKNLIFEMCNFKTQSWRNDNIQQCYFETIEFKIQTPVTNQDWYFFMELYPIFTKLLSKLMLDIYGQFNISELQCNHLKSLTLRVCHEFTTVMICNHIKLQELTLYVSCNNINFDIKNGEIVEIHNIYIYFYKTFDIATLTQFIILPQLRKLQLVFASHVSEITAKSERTLEYAINQRFIRYPTAKPLHIEIFHTEIPTLVASSLGKYKLNNDKQIHIQPPPRPKLLL